ncbi:MAG: glycosyltransferase family 2 protein [Lachnospiraceae bacterium]|nr:glycosyltransferase family 2 protein [Lachnospiraceae bacterium]
MREITVVIPNYNGMKYLPECLQALSNQESGTPDFAVLVVDNGSTDGSVEFLREYEENANDKIKSILLSENTGFCHAVNVGIEAAQTPYVLLLNNDTKPEPGFVKHLYKAIQKDEKIFSVSACMLMWDKPELLDDAGDRYCALGWAYARGKGKPAAAYDRAVQVFSACGGAVIYRKSVFDKIGLFDEAHFMYLEDLDVGYRARIHGYQNWYEPEAKVLHYGSASTGSRYNKTKTAYASANSVYVVGKNMPSLQLLLNLPFLLTGFAIKFLFFVKKKMGRTYLQGLVTGLKKCFSEEGRRKHVAFSGKNLWNYVRIQGELYLGMFQILMKS